MPLYKNYGRWKNFDCIFGFSVKSYIRDTINLSWDKILLTSHMLRQADRSLTGRSLCTNRHKFAICTEVLFFRLRRIYCLQGEGSVRPEAPITKYPNVQILLKLLQRLQTRRLFVKYSFQSSLMLLVVSSIHKRRAGLNESERASSWETLGHVIWRAINLHGINHETWRWDFNASRWVHKWLQSRLTQFASVSVYRMTSATPWFLRVLLQDDFSQLLKECLTLTQLLYNPNIHCRFYARSYSYEKRPLASSCLSVCLSVWLAGWLSVCLFVCPSVRLEQLGAHWTFSRNFIFKYIFLANSRLIKIWRNEQVF
jgi:hypothetical protein